MFLRRLVYGEARGAAYYRRERKKQTFSGNFESENFVPRGDCDKGDWKQNCQSSCIGVRSCVSSVNILNIYTRHVSGHLAADTFTGSSSDLSSERRDNQFSRAVRLLFVQLITLIPKLITKPYHTSSLGKQPYRGFVFSPRHVEEVSCRFINKFNKNYLPPLPHVQNCIVLLLSIMSPEYPKGVRKGGIAKLITFLEMSNL